MDNTNIVNLEQKRENVCDSTPATEKRLNEDCTSSDVATGCVKLYKFRKLNSTDLFPMIKLIAKIGIDELTEVFEGDSIKGIVESVSKKEKTIAGREIIAGVGVALKLVNKIMEHLPYCDNEIYILLSRVSGMSVDQIKILDIDVFMEMILEFVTKDEFKDFFKVASRYIKALG